jgi:Carboxypeptidase regulatory-like domain
MMLAALVLVLATSSQAQTRDVAPAAPRPAGTGIIRGRVVAADNGVPIRRALVTIAGIDSAGRWSTRTIYTDVQGRYEARSLPRGSYIVSVRPNQFQGQFLEPTPPASPSPDGPPRIPLADGQIVEGYDLALPRAGAIVGRLIDENGDPVSGLSVGAIRPGDRPDLGGYLTQSSDEFGRYRIAHLAPGEYQLLARTFAGGDSMMQGQSLGFVDTYHPGTPSRDEAGRVRVRAGQETTAGDLQMSRVRMLRLKGTVLDSHGAPAPNGTMVSLSKPPSSIGLGVDARGRFDIRQPQPPGTYRLSARLLDEGRANTLEYANIPITLVDADLDDLVISMKPTVTVAGRVVFDPVAPPVVASTALTIRVEPKDRSTSSELPFAQAPVAPDLTFALRRLAGGLLVRPNFQSAAGWVLKAVMLGDQDITDIPTEFRAEDSGRLQVVLTNRAAEVSGSVTNDKGEPAWSSNVVLFSDDKASWFPSSIRLRLAWTGRDGRFSMKGLRSGRYYVIALPQGRTLNIQSVDAAALDALLREATPLIVGEDEQRVIDLKVAAAGGGV